MGTKIKINVLGIKEEDFTKSIVTEKKDGLSLGVPTFTGEKDLYKKYRPEEITDEMEDAVDKYREDFVASVSAVAGEMAVKSMESEGDQCLIKADMRRRGEKIRIRVSHTTRRTYNEVDPEKQDENGNPLKVSKESVKHGVSTVSVRTNYGRKVGPIASSASYLQKMAEDHYKDK